MRIVSAIAISTAILSGCATSARSERGLASSDDRLAAVAFLSGIWRGEHGGAVLEERWSEPEGGSMIATGRTFMDGRTVFFEFMKIDALEDGTIVLTAWPKGDASTAFKLTSAGKGLAVFENPAHDFPQRIEYALKPDRRLEVTISAGSQKESWTLLPQER